jgi:ligand-binding sensor domain-containing protein
MGADGSLWMGTREGALHSVDGGNSWQHMLGGLPSREVFAVHYDSAGRRLLATARFTHGVYESRDNGRSWQLTPDAGVSIRSATNYQGRLLGTSAYNGLLLEQDGTVEAASRSSN